MLFNSMSFIFLFLPLTLLIYYALIRLGHRNWVFLFLVGSSLVFYSVWNPPYVFLLMISMAFNYIFGRLIEKTKVKGSAHGWILISGVMANLLLLGYYKYAGFFIENLNALSGTDFTLHRIILPLGISFYTFQQIAYLVDISRGDIKSGRIAHYATFVIFFPQLIAGPIVHYRDMMHQFFDSNLGQFWRSNLLIGLVIFAIGLFKKTVIADSAAGFSSPVFNAVHAGDAITFFDGWRAALCYKIQLYFDFSGYSDMAVGLARMFGLLLPPNFHSPLRAFSIIDYWRRWHMTLQQFIVSYMYQPLAIPLTRSGARRRFGKWTMFVYTVTVPTVIVFLISGLWHGAAWTFVIWGLMHGVFLAVNEFWRMFRRKARRLSPPGALDNTLYFVLTLTSAVIASTMFRAEAPSDAVAIWAAMLKFDQAGAIINILPSGLGELFTKPFAFCLLAGVIIFLFPNTQQLMSRYRPVLYWDTWKSVGPALLQMRWRLNLAWAIWTGFILFAGVVFIFRGQSEFIYFNF